MTGKEALDKIVLSFEDCINIKNCHGQTLLDNKFADKFNQELDIIQKDLERLEKLEEAIKIILKSYTVVPYIVASDGYDDYKGICEYVHDKPLIKEEYEILKEVLCDE